MSLIEDIKTNVEENTNLQTEKKEKKEYQPRKVQYSYFGMILYPEEDEMHSLILQELLTQKTLFPKVVYINHDRDIYTQDIINPKGLKEHYKGETKKAHLHVLFKARKKSTPSGMMKHWKGMISKIIGVEDEYAYATYMTHFNAVCQMQGKPIYDKSEVQGDEQFKLDLFIQNTNSTQFYELLQLAEKTENFFKLAKYANEKGDKYIELLRKYGVLFIQAQNQINH